MIKKLILLLMLTMLVLASCRDKNPGFVVASSNNEVTIADISKDVPEIIWSWRSDSTQSLPLSMKLKFLSITDCKPASDSREILITSSGGGVALISVKDKTTRFYVDQPNAQSAEQISDNVIAVAASYSPEGNKVALFSAGTPGELIASDTLTGAAGLCFDRDNNLLYAIGKNELRKYIVNKSGEAGYNLVPSGAFILPAGKGRDVVSLNGGTDLLVVTDSAAWVFNSGSTDFISYEKLDDVKNIRSVSYNSSTGDIAYIAPPGYSIIGYYIRFAGSQRVVYLPYERLTKARWLY